MTFCLIIAKLPSDTRWYIKHYKQEEYGKTEKEDLFVKRVHVGDLVRFRHNEFHEREFKADHPYGRKAKTMIRDPIWMAAHELQERIDDNIVEALNKIIDN